MKTKRIICLYGGPGSGKSTTCAGLFYKLKILGYNCEMNREYVKEWVWEGRDIKLGDQSYIFAKQARKERLYIQQGLDYIISDCPLVLTHFYGLKFDETEKKYNTSLMMLKNHHGFCKDYNYKVEHFVLKRPEVYNTSGRYQSKQVAETFDAEIKQLLSSLNIKYTEIDMTNSVDDIIAELSKD